MNILIEKLIETDIYLNIYDFIHHINNTDKFNIELLKYIMKDVIIDYKILKKYIDDIDYEILKNYGIDFIENIDYTKNGVNSDTFKILLFRYGKIEDIKHYIFLEKCVKSHNNYYINLRAKYIENLEKK